MTLLLLFANNGAPPPVAPATTPIGGHGRRLRRRVRVAWTRIVHRARVGCVEPRMRQRLTVGDTTAAQLTLARPAIAVRLRQIVTTKLATASLRLAGIRCQVTAAVDVISDEEALAAILLYRRQNALGAFSLLRP